jgi:hypothetical protein
VDYPLTLFIIFKYIILHIGGALRMKSLKRASMLITFLMVSGLILLTAGGCAPKSILWNGSTYTPIPVPTLDALDSQMKQDGVVLLQDMAPSRVTAEKKADYTKAANVTMLAVDASFYGLQYAKVVAAASAGINIAMAWSSIGDLIKLTGEAVKNKDTVYTQIKFSEPVEIERVRNGKHDSVMAFRMSAEQKAKEIQMLKECNWIANFRRVFQKGSGKMYKYNEDNGTSKNFSTTGDQTVFFVRYPHEANNLPEDNACSVKSAELYLAEMVKRISENAVISK